MIPKAAFVFGKVYVWVNGDLAEVGLQRIWGLM
jgi:hypothetical protein